jgi:hypothetical protein
VAFADWKYIETNQSGASFFIDYSTIQDSGDYKKFWVMIDLKTPYLDSIRSVKRQMALDCKLKTVKGLYIIGFSGNLTKGQVLMDGAIDSDATPISPNSIEEDFFKLICK